VQAENFVVVAATVLVRETFGKIGPRSVGRKADDCGGNGERRGGGGRVVRFLEAGAQVATNRATVVKGSRGQGGVHDVGRCNGGVDGGGYGEVAGFAGGDEGRRLRRRED